MTGPRPAGTPPGVAAPGGDRFALDPTGVRRAFTRAAATCDAVAVLQREVRARLLERLELVKIEPQVVVDAGAGTGHGTIALKRRYRASRVIALDLAEAMLREARHQQTLFRRFDRVCADFARLPFADHSVDLLFSNLTLQWCGVPDAVFGECRRVLRPGGLLTFTTLGPDTLRELRAAWAAVDADTHVNRFIDMHDLGDALVRAGLAEPVMDVERYTLTYRDARELMRDLKALGAHNVNAGRPRGLVGKGRLAGMLSAYEQFRRSEDGRLPATCEVVFGHAWAPAVRGPRTREIAVPVAGIGRRRREE